MFDTVKKLTGEKRLVFGRGPQETVAVLEWARQAAELTACGLSTRLGVSTTTVQEYREGRRPRAGWLFVVRWLAACGVRVVLERVDDGLNTSHG